MSSEKKPFLLRVEKSLLDTLQKWADDDLRSLNSQIDFLLRKAVKEGGRATTKGAPPVDETESSTGPG